jgi:hypothetical protein
MRYNPEIDRGGLHQLGLSEMGPRQLQAVGLGAARERSEPHRTGNRTSADQSGAPREIPA